MANYLLELRFNGGAYHGFQIQKNADTVQARLQQALGTALGMLPDIKGCSRTDAGVHANCYCVSFICGGIADEDRFLRSMNALLPQDIRANSIRAVPNDFHARYSCVKKSYRYLICSAPVMDPFLNGLAVHFTPEFDCEKVNAALRPLIGTHDFSAFCGEKGKKEDCTRTLYQLAAERNGQVVSIVAQGNGFLYNMVRIIAGAAMNAARGKLDAAAVESILKSRRRSLLCPTAPACGLYLDKVEYNID